MIFMGVIDQLTFTYSKSTIETLEICSDVFIVNFEYIPHLFPVFLLWTLNK